jgi:hypothetical protein
LWASGQLAYASGRSIQRPLWVIFDRVIERSLQIDVRFDPDSDRGRTALQYVAKGHKPTYAVQQKPLLFDHLVGESKQLSRFIQSEAFFPS